VQLFYTIVSLKKLISIAIYIFFLFALVVYNV